MDSSRKIFAIVLIYGIFLAFLVLFLSKVIAFDESLFFVIYSLSNTYLEMFFNIITYIGSSIFWILLIVLFWFKNKKKLSIHLLFALILNTVSLIILKWIFLRPRPFETSSLGKNFDIFDVSDPSFPSGHSQQVFSGMFILSKYYKKYEVLFYALAFLVSLSRIFLGLHYPLDVLIGAINGIIVGMIAFKIPTKRIEKFLKH